MTISYVLFIEPKNTDSLKRLKNIFEALNIIAKERQIILPFTS